MGSETPSQDQTAILWLALGRPLHEMADLTEEQIALAWPALKMRAKLFGFVEFPEDEEVAVEVDGDEMTDEEAQAYCERIVKQFGGQV